MSELETRLRAVEPGWPPTPDLAARVERALSEPSDKLSLGRPRRRRALALALAVAAAALATALAVPSARTALLRFFHLDGATVERVERLPRVPTTGQLDLGERVSLEEAGARAGFRPVIPSELGDPDEVYVRPSGVVSLVWGEGDARAVLSQVRGAIAEEFFKKAAANVEPLMVDGAQAVWVPGPHFFMWRTPDGEIRDEPPYLAGSTLLWERDGLTLRLEADLTLPEAVAIAESVE